MTKGSGGPCVGVCVQMGWRGKSAEGGVWVPRGWLLGCRTKVSQAPGPALALISPTPTSPSADLYSEEPGEEEPAWVQTERQQFREFRDLNKDGQLDGSEVGYWVLPPSQDQPLVEANHLLHESDTDKVSLGYYCLHAGGSGNRERNGKRPRDRSGETDGGRGLEERSQAEEGP